jgi:hypothetical protein
MCFEPISATAAATAATSASAAAGAAALGPAAAAAASGASVGAATAGGGLLAGLTTADYLLAGAGLLSAGGSAMQAGAQADAIEAQAQIERQRADRERRVSAIEALQRRKRNSALLASQRAGLAASGGDLGSGTALLLQTDSAGEAAYEEELIRAGGNTRGTRLEQQARLNQSQAGSTRTSGGFRAGTTLLSTGARMFG